MVGARRSEFLVEQTHAAPLVTVTGCDPHQVVVHKLLLLQPRAPAGGEAAQRVGRET